ncbi:MAG TPA: nuclear transport factor 2 family protein [Candidatus Saccharimonadia bacterium]|nr:nuclear transport factor 2 family protein [Candidatus Saccharimonadia bacterium]
MTESVDIAKLYFDLSNNSDFEGIKKLFTDTTQYVSQNTGLHTGRTKIMEMQRVFHAKFANLHWHVNNIQEVRRGVILVDYDFTGVTSGGEKVETSGFEYVTVQDDKIVKIEIKNKS